MPREPKVSANKNLGSQGRTTADGNSAPVEKASPSPSGRGASGGGAGSSRIDNPDRRTGQLPIWTDGDPSSSPDVTASRLMQSVIMGDDDKEWYKELNKKQVKHFLEPRNTVGHGFDIGLNCSLEIDGAILGENMKNCLACSIDICNVHLHEAKRKKKKELLAEPDASVKGRKKKEANAVGSGQIAGYELPLGMSNQTRRKRKQGSTIAAHSFGGGNFVE